MPLVQVGARARPLGLTDDVARTLPALTAVLPLVRPAEKKADTPEDSKPAKGKKKGKKRRGASDDLPPAVDDEMLDELIENHPAEIKTNQICMDLSDKWYSVEWYAESVLSLSHGGPRVTEASVSRRPPCL